MDVTADELAGVVDLFGGLTRAELERALSEAAFRVDGSSLEEATLETAIDDALESFALVAAEPAVAEPNPADGLDADERPQQIFVAGPTAFPTLPEGAEDVPHILEIERRRLDRDAIGETVYERFVEDVSAALEADDDRRCRRLLDLSYDIEAWAPVELAAERERLEAA